MLNRMKSHLRRMITTDGRKFRTRISKSGLNVVECLEDIVLEIGFENANGLKQALKM